MCHIGAELGELRLSPANRACQFGFERTSYGTIAIGDSLSGPKSGTARMSESPNSGVVNADGRVHRLENLYVVGCATSPTSGQATPMLAVVI
jgi:choline dehydrogenase-like flavoprotein